MLTAIFNPASLALVLMLRLVNDAARSSAMTTSTVGTAARTAANGDWRLSGPDRGWSNAGVFII